MKNNQEEMFDFDLETCPICEATTDLFVRCSSRRINHGSLSDIDRVVLEIYPYKSVSSGAVDVLRFACGASYWRKFSTDFNIPYPDMDLTPYGTVSQLWTMSAECGQAGRIARELLAYKEKKA